MTINLIKFPIKQLISEPETCSRKARFSHPVFTRKLPKGVVPCDYDRTEKLIEIEYSNGARHWFELSTFFGIVIAEAKQILIFYPDETTEEMSIVGIEVFKRKLTLYWKLIFERDLPF